MKIIHLPRRGGKTYQLFEFILNSPEKEIFVYNSFGIPYSHRENFIRFLRSRDIEYVESSYNNDVKFLDKTISHIISYYPNMRNQFVVIDNFGIITSRRIFEDNKILAITINDDRYGITDAP